MGLLGRLQAFDQRLVDVALLRAEVDADEFPYRFSHDDVKRLAHAPELLRHRRQRQGECPTIPTFPRLGNSGGQCRLK